MRDLSLNEMGFVNGAFSWGELAGAVVGGAAVGALAGAAGGITIAPAAAAGAALGGLGYCVSELVISIVDK